MGKKSKKVTITRNKKGVVICFGIVAILLIILLGKTAYIQLIDDEFYREEANEQQTSDVTVLAKRGDIVDRNGTILATSVTSYQLYCYPNKILEEYTSDEIFEMASKIGEIVYKDTSEIYTILATKTEEDDEEVLVTDYITRTQVNDIKALKYSGLSYDNDYTRYYPFGDFASQLLGSMTVDDTGRSGLELQYDQYLSGIDGRWVKLTDVNGNELQGSDSSYYDAQDGLNVVTTIDSTIQYYVEEALKAACETYNPSKMMCIVMDPNNGEILASAVSNGFDPNDPYYPTNEKSLEYYKTLDEADRVSYLSRLWRNPIVSNDYELGSVCKLFFASAALEEMIIDTDDTLSCNGGLKVDDYVIACANGEIHGVETVKDAVSNSCNIVLAQLILKLGRKTSYKYIEAFGLDETTGIDYPAEATSIVKDMYGLADIDLVTMSYGQGIALTPIQYITAANAVINGGYLYTPRYVSALTDNDGNVVVSYDTNLVRQVLSEETSEIMRDILEYTATYGSANRAYIAGYRVGGKTGSAEKEVGGEYASQVLCYYAAAPMDDPEVSIFIVMDEPENSGFASTIVAPIAKEILENILPYLGVEPVYEDISEEESGKEVEVPDITGMTYEDAKYYLEVLGLQIEIADTKDEVEDFEITAQYPLSGKMVEENSTVYVYRG